MSNPMTKSELDALIAAAQEAALSAYAPYSEFRVGAALLTDQGMIVGANVENASYGLSLCGERSALANAVVRKAGTIRAIAVACIDAKEGQGLNELMPCGACRQWMIELAPDADVVICGKGDAHVFEVKALLPHPFVLGSGEEGR